MSSSCASGRALFALNAVQPVAQALFGAGDALVFGVGMGIQDMGCLAHVLNDPLFMAASEVLADRLAHQVRATALSALRLVFKARFDFRWQASTADIRQRMVPCGSVYFEV